MRTSTGSISVMKIIQKNTIRSGKRKNTMAKADRIEMTILPMAIATATIVVFIRSRATLTPPMRVMPPNRASL